MDLLEIEEKHEMRREEAAKLLRRIADSLSRQNDLEFVREGKKITVDVPDQVEVELNDGQGRKVLVTQALGQVFMKRPFDDPFSALETVLKQHTLGGVVQAAIVDFHAEATSEKMGMGHWCDGMASLEVRVNDTMTSGCAGYSAGFAGTGNLLPLARVALRRAANWQRQPQLIGSDRGNGSGGSHV